MINRIFITGFRATGKSTVAKHLAQKMGWDFLDMDAEIVKRTGHSVNQITKSGTNWKDFRRMEHDLIQELCGKEKLVVSTGGGALVNDYISDEQGKTYGQINRELISKSCDTKIILLTAPWPELEKRILRKEKAHHENARPILSEKEAKSAHIQDGKTSLEAILKDSYLNYKKREPEYNKLTDLVFNSGENDSREIALEIFERL